MKTTIRVLSLLLVSVMLCAALASCAPASDPDKALKALKDDGYTAEKFDSSLAKAAATLLGADNVTAIVTGTKTVKDKDGNDKVESVFIYYFGTKDDAEKYKDKIESKYEEDKKDATEEEKKDMVFGQSGKIVYFGTKAAVKAAR